MLACSSCRRFVRDASPRCPFCGQILADARSPMGGFLGVLLGVSLAACGGGTDDEDDGASASATEASGSTADPTAASDTDSASGGVSGSGSMTTTDPETTGPMYGPITGVESSDGGGSETGSSGDTGGEETAGSTDTGDSTAGNDGESASPLYGPVLTTGQ